MQPWKLQSVKCVLLNEALNCQDKKNEYGGLVEWCWQGENQGTQEETHPITILSTTNLTWTGLGLILGIFYELSWPYNLKLWLKRTTLRVSSRSSGLLFIWRSGKRIIDLRLFVTLFSIALSFDERKQNLTLTVTNHLVTEAC